MSGWVPDSDSVQQVVSLLQMTQNSSRENHKALYEKLKQMEQHQEFAAYLCHVFVNVNQVDFFCKQQAGLLLKNQIKRFWANAPPNARQYIQSQIPNALAHEKPQIRKYAAISIGMILFRGGLDCWPQLLESLLNVLNSDNLNAIHGSLLCLEGLCQGQQCRIEEERQGETFDTCNFICADPRAGDVVQICIKFMLQENYSEYRRLSMECLLQLANHHSQAFEQHVQNYVTALYSIAKDDSIPIRVLLCKSFIMLLNLHYQQIHQNIDQIIRFMLLCLKEDQPDEIRIQSGEFWSHWSHNQQIDASVLLPHLDELADKLLNSMHYSEEELSEIEAENDDQGQDDRPDEIDPSWQETDKNNSLKAPEAEMIEQSHNTVRRSTARALDNLAIRYQNELLKILLPKLEERMNHQNWMIRESAILALGAIGVGCREDIEQYLDSIMPFLCQRITDNHYLIRCIACWTLSRFCSWFLKQKDDNKLLVPLMEKMLSELVLDKSKRVQQAAISAVASLLEQGQARMIPYIEIITQQLQECLVRYKLKNLPFLFDCLMVLLSYFHETISQSPELFQSLIDVAVRRLMCLDDDQPAVFGVLEFLSNTAVYLGEQFHRWAPMIWDRCTRMANGYLQATRIAEQHKANNQDYDFPRIQIFTISIDMLSAITEAVNGEIEKYVKSEDNILPIIEGGIQLSIPACKHVIFGLLGVLVDPISDPNNMNGKSMLPILRSHMDKLIPLAIENLTPHNEQLFVNANYFIGQTVKRVPKMIEPFLQPMMKRLVQILKMPIPPQMSVPFLGTQIGPSRQTYCSACFTVARIAHAYEKEVSSVFSEFALEWAYHLGLCQEDEEKTFAYRVFFRQVQANPNVFLQEEIGVSVLCNSIASWWEPSDTFLVISKQMISQFKQAIVQNGGDWEKHMGRMDENLVGTFRSRYDV